MAIEFQATSEPKHDALPKRLGQLLGQWVDASDRAIVVGNRAGVVEWTNDAWTRITGQARGETISKPVGRFLTEARIDVDLVDFVQTCFLRGSRCEVEFPFTGPDDQLSWIHLSVDSIRDEFGEVSDFVAVAEDVTCRKLQESEADEKPAQPDYASPLPAVRDPGLLPSAATSRKSLSDLAQQWMSKHFSLFPPQTGLDIDVDPDVPPVAVDVVQLGRWIEGQLHHSAAAMSDEWGTLSVTTGSLADGDRHVSPTYPGLTDIRHLSHYPYAFVEIHDTGKELSRLDLGVARGQVTSDSVRPRVADLALGRSLLRAHGGDLVLDSGPGCGTRILLLIPA